MVPAGTVLCVPSKSTECWVMAALFPEDTEMEKKGWECHPRPVDRLGQQPKGKRIAKRYKDYQGKAEAFRAAWPDVVSRLEGASGFAADFQSCVGGLSKPT